MRHFVYQMQRKGHLTKNNFGFWLSFFLWINMSKNYIDILVTFSKELIAAPAVAVRVLWIMVCLFRYPDVGIGSLVFCKFWHGVRSNFKVELTKARSFFWGGGGGSFCPINGANGLKIRLFGFIKKLGC